LILLEVLQLARGLCLLQWVLVRHYHLHYHLLHLHEQLVVLVVGERLVVVGPAGPVCFLQLM